MISSSCSERAGRACKQAQRGRVCYHKKKTYWALNDFAVVVMEVEAKSPVEVFWAKMEILLG